MRPTFEFIQRSVLNESLATLGEALMGSTLTALLVADGKAHICHVGDSRCYFWSDGDLKCLTTDHEVFDDHYGGPVLSSYMGLPPELHELTIQEVTETVKPGDRFLLCSDGLYKQIDEGRLIEHIQNLRIEPERLIDVICNEAAQLEYSDNVTAIWVTID